MHPDIEATLCDYLTTDPMDRWGDGSLDALVKGFFETYWVIEDEHVAAHEVHDFLYETFALRKRCQKCGENKFPYFMSGDQECIKH